MMIVPKSILIGMGGVIGTGLMITTCGEEDRAFGERFTYSVPSRPRFLPTSPTVVPIAALKPLDFQNPPDLIVYDPNAARFHKEWYCGGCGMG